MISFFKLIFFLLIIYILFNIIRFFLGLSVAAGRVKKNLDEMERLNRENRKEEEIKGPPAGGKTIELGKDQYKVK